VEALQQGSGHGVRGNDFLHGGFHGLLHIGSSLGREALFEALGSDWHAEGRGSLSQLLIGGIGLVEPSKDEALHELGAGELGAALHETGGLCGLVGDGGQNGL
jgi:hypothetical protein